MAAVQAQDCDWQSEAVSLKRAGLESKDIAEALDKHPATIRKVIARAREAGELPNDELSIVAGAPEREFDEDGIAAELNGDRDPLEDFKAEAGEAVGPMPPSEPENTDPDTEVRLAGTRQMALDFGPEADTPVGGTIVLRSEKLASGFFGLGDVIEGRFTARVVKVGAEEKADKDIGEYRAKPVAHVALITELAVD